MRTLSVAQSDAVARCGHACLQMAVVEGAPEECCGSGRVAKLAVAIVNEVYSAHNGVTAPYKAKFRALHFNMKDDKNPDLRRKVAMRRLIPHT